MHFNTLRGNFIRFCYFEWKIIEQLDCSQSVQSKVSVRENEVPTEKNSSRASIFATKASYTSN